MKTSLMTPVLSFLRSAFLPLILVSHALSSVAFSQALRGYQPGATPFNFATTPGALAKTVVPQRSSVHFTLDPYADTFSGTVTHQIQVTAPTSTVALHAADLNIGAVALAGSAEPVTVSTDKPSQTITLALTKALSVGTHEITLAFQGKLTANGYGLYYAKYRSKDGTDRRMMVSNLEPIGAREMLPCFDEPSFRTVWQVSITTAEKYTALSNMPVAKQTLSAGQRRTDFAPTPSMASYLLAVAVGEFDRVTDRVDNTDLAIYAVAGKAQNLSYAMEATKRLLAYYKDYFGTAYPLPKLDQIAVPGKRGAMENWGLITYSEDLLIVDPARATYEQRFYAFVVIAHEISHQWFGNLVTMAWWDGLWLNESFAEWMGYKATAALNPQWNLIASRAQARERAMAVDALASTLPIERTVARDQNAEELFDAISYEKGHSVLTMVERFAGERAWRDGLRDYLKKHEYSNATSADLWAAMSRKTDVDVQAFANAWTRQAGFPLLNVSTSCASGTAGDSGEQTVTLTQSRFALKVGYVPQQTWSLAVLVSRPGATDEAKQTVFVDVLRPKQIKAGRCGEAVLVDVGGAGYYRVNYDAALEKLLAAQRSKLATGDRLRMLSDAWALAEAGQAEPKRAFDLISGLAADDAPELWNEAMNVYTSARQLLRTGTLADALDSYACRTLRHPFAALGWQENSGEPDNTRSLRGNLIAALGACGDAAVLEAARQRFAAFLADAASVKGDVLSGVLRAVGAHATAAELEKLTALIESGKFSELEWPLMAAISASRDPLIAKRALALALTDRLPRSMAQRLVSRIAGNGLHDSLAWQFTKDNQAALFERTSSHGRPYVFTAPLRASRDTALAMAVKAEAEKVLEPDLRSEVRREVASVERSAWAFDAVREKLAFLLVEAGK